jgi:hypothetical protein
VNCALQLFAASTFRFLSLQFVKRLLADSVAGFFVKSLRAQDMDATLVFGIWLGTARCKQDLALVVAPVSLQIARN